MSATSSGEVAPIKGKLWIERRRTYVAYAMILFNIYGSTLSYGPYLEYYYTTQNYGIDNVSQASAIIAVRLLCICIAPLPIARLFQQHLWRGSIYTPSLIIPVCQLLTKWLRYWWALLLVQGVIQGLALGTLGTAGLLSLSTHYKNNIPLVSMIGSAAGFAGALVYTGVAYHFLPYFKPDIAAFVNTGIACVTLGLASYLLQRNGYYARLGHLKKQEKTIKRPSSSFKNKPAALAIFGFWLISCGIFVWPTFVILQISNAPAYVFATEATKQLFYMYGLAVPSAVICTLPSLRSRLGPVNAFICAAAVAGICYFNPASMPWQVVSMPHAGVYGICLGVILALYIKVLYTVTMFNRPKGSPACHRDVGLALAGAGVSAAAGIVFTGLVTDHVKGGLRLGLTVVGCVILAGACCMAVGRYWGLERKFYFAV